jgi:general stress protein 26
MFNAISMLKNKKRILIQSALAFSEAASDTSIWTPSADSSALAGNVKKYSLIRLSFQRISNFQLI